ALTDVARGLGEDLVDLLTAEVLVLGLEELLGLQVRDGGGEGTLVDPGLNTLTRVGVLDEGVTKSRVLGVGRDRKGAAAVLRADHLAFLPLRERGHPPGTLTLRDPGVQVESHPRPTDQGGGASVTQGLVPLVGPV